MSINYLDKTGLEHIGDIANYKKRNIDYTTYTGTDLEIEDTLENKIDFNNLYGQTEQDGTPTPTNPQEVKTVTGRQVVKITGKNLFNKNAVELGKIVSRTDGTLSDAANYNASNYIPMKENTTYTLTALNFNRWYSACYDENKNYIGYVENEATFTTISGTKYMRITVYNNLMDTAMIVEGNTVPDIYEEYKEQSYELNLGKNLFDKDNPNVVDSAFINGSTGVIETDNNSKLIYIPCKSNTTYTISKIVTSRFRASYSTDEPTLGITTSGVISNYSGTSITITTGTNANYLVVWVYNSGLDTITFDEILASIQIEKGEEATSYSPYFTPIELCEIGDYQDSVKKSTGKNLFSSEIELGNITGTGTKEDSTTRCRTKDFISIKPNTTYSLWNNKSQTYNLYFYDENKNYLSYLYVSGNSFTTPANSKYIMFLFGNVVLDILVMLNEGPTALPYEPYGVGKWYVEKKIGKVVLDGSEDENYNKLQTLTNTITFIFSQDIGAKLNIASEKYYLSNYYVSNNDYSLDNEHFYVNNNGYIVIFVNSSRLNGTTVDAFKTWLSTHNTEVYYPLSTPTGEEITDEELIEQLNGLYDAFYMNSKTYINVEGDLPIVLEINHDKPRFLNLIDKGELQKYIMDLEKRVAYWNHK